MRPAFSWADVEPEEHAVAFTVAKAMDLDVLEAIRGEVQKALDEGLPLATFKKNFRANPALSQWWGKREMVDPVTGELIEAQLGSPRRLKTIYNANLRSARAAGQWERIERTRSAFPYLEYRLGPSEHHRVHHQDKAGMILPVESAFWDEWMPPNGWGCKCWVRQVTKREAARRGISTTPDVPDRVWTNERTGEKAIVPEGIDPGWQRNPGKLRREAMEGMLRGKLESAPANVQAAALRDIATSWRTQRILSEGAPGIATVAAVPSQLSQHLDASTNLVAISRDTADKQLRRHPEVLTNDYAKLADLMLEGKVLLQDKRNLVFLSHDELPWIAVIKRTIKGDELFLTTFYRASSSRYVRRLIARGTVVRE
ncbi:MAG: hypothetical protein JXR35_03980 [Rhodobacteraceae bacterium]|nr:hypothetical protein [Paracoccaceae bacterium]